MAPARTCMMTPGWMALARSPTRDFLLHVFLWVPRRHVRLIISVAPRMSSCPLVGGAPFQTGLGGKRIPSLSAFFSPPSPPSTDPSGPHTVLMQTLELGPISPFCIFLPHPPLPFPGAPLPNYEGLFVEGFYQRNRQFTSSKCLDPDYLYLLL